MNTLLSSSVKISDYKEFVETQNSEKIIEFIKQRFSERYIMPMRVEKYKKNGFTIMAISCLMIEALESFYQGWNNSNRKSQLAFFNFFDRNDNFLFIRDYSQEFYKYVRCGILHQGETTNGWHIRRDGKIFNETTKTINAKLFHDQIEASLTNYCKKLEHEEWSSNLWENLRKKMNAICNNCES